METDIDFWTEAVQQPHLDVDILRDSTNVKHLLDYILNRITQLHKDVAQRNLCFARPNGAVIILHDILWKMKHRLQVCSSIIEDMVIADPNFELTMIALRNLLRPEYHDPSILGYVAEALDMATNTLAQYFILEILYLFNYSPSSDTAIIILRNSIISSYRAIIQYFNSAANFCAKGIRERPDADARDGMERRSRLLKQEINQKESEVLQQVLLLRHAMQACKLNEFQEQLLNSFDGLRSPVVRVTDDVWQIEDDLDAHTRPKFLDWLSTIPSLTHLRYEDEDTLPGTGSWLLEHPEFRTWQDSSTSDIFWLSGIPGSGKSKLTAKVARHYLDQHYSVAKIQISFAFLAFSQKGDDKRRNDPHEALLSILRQLCGGAPDLPLRGDAPQEYIRRMEFANEQNGTIPRLTTGEAITQILSITDVAPSVIVIDALDEIDKGKRHVMLEALDKIIKSSSNVIKVFVSSRWEPDIVSVLQSVNGIRNVEDLNMSDIDSFIKSSLSYQIKARQDLQDKIPTSLRGDIEAFLSARAQGMFRWVELSMNVLFNRSTTQTEDSIRRCLSTLPPSLQEQYRLIYDDIVQSSSYRAGIAHRTFAWMLAAQRPMTTAEYIAAIAIDENGNQSEDTNVEAVLDITRNLIRETTMGTSDNVKTLQFVHLSVREFLEGVSELSVQSVHGVALQRCLHELCHDAEESSCYPRGSLLPYSKYLFEHARSTTLTHTSSELTKPMLEFLWTSAFDESHTYAQWIDLFKEHEDYWFKQLDELNEDDKLYVKIFRFGSMYIPAINLVCKYGLLAIIYSLPVEIVAPWIYDGDRYSTPPLYEATSTGNYRIAKWILTNAIFPPDGGEKHASALYRAAWDGDEPMVRLLLSHGADPLGRAHETVKFTGTPLCMGFSTPLAWANEKGGDKVVDKTGTIKAMIDHIEEEQMRDPNSFSDLALDWKVETLYQALQSNQEQIALLMLDRVSDLHQRTSASATGVNQIRYWWERRRFYSGDNFPKSPLLSSLLHVAVYGSKPPIVQELLARCLNRPTTRDIIQNHSSKDPIPTAITDSSVAAINVRDGINRTPLHYLMDRNESGTVQIFNMLAESGANMTATSDYGVAAVHVAAAIGALEIFNYLDHEYELLHAVDSFGANALHYTALGDAPQHIIEVFIERFTSAGLSLTSTDCHGNTPIHYASGANNLAFMRAVDKLFASHNVRSIDAGTTRPCKSMQHPNTARDLVEKPDGVQIPQSTTSLASLMNEESQTPLHTVSMAARKASNVVDEGTTKKTDQAMIHHLISMGAQVNAQDAKGRTPWMVLVMKHSITIPAMEELWSAGANCEISDSSGRTIMHYAARCSMQDEGKLKALFDRGVAINVQDHHGDTPLHHAACSYLNVRAIGLLIRHGAQVGTCSSMKATPLHYANHVDIIEVLVRNGAEVDAQDHRGRTPLLVMLEKDNLYEHIKDLYGKHEDFNSIHRKKAAVECLLKHGADPTVCDTTGRTASQFADELDDQEIKDIIAGAIEKWGLKSSQHNLVHDGSE